MCKIMIIPGINPKRLKATKRFIEASIAPLTERDNDGFGYSAVAKNKLFGERWLHAKSAFKSRQKYTPGVNELLDRYGSAVTATEQYNSFGDVQKSLNGVTSICLHARMSTNDVSMQNTHPFVDGDTALIHNGIVDSTLLHTPTSTCDSEGILTEYLKHNIPAEPSNFQKVADNLSGYYACGVFAKDNHGRYILDVFKDNDASLYCIKIPALDTVVFCTSVEIVKETAKKCKMRIGAVVEITENTLFRLNASTGQRIGEALHFEKLIVPKDRDLISENTDFGGFDVYDGDLSRFNDGERVDEHTQRDT